MFYGHLPGQVGKPHRSVDMKLFYLKILIRLSVFEVPAFAFGSSKTKRLAKAKRKVERCIITVRIENYRYNR